jgi:hypothetical protein
MLDQRDGRHLLAVDGDRTPLLEGDLDGRLSLGFGGPLVDLRRRLVVGILQFPSLDRPRPDVLVDRPDAAVARLDREVLLGGVVDLPLARESELANGCDHLEVRAAPHRLEPKLVVPFARTAVCDRVTPLLLGDRQNRFRDDGARECGPKRVPLVRRVGFHRVETQLRELRFRVDNVKVESERLRRLLGLVELLGRLADVDVDADDLVVAVLFFQEWYTDRGVESAAERECNACHY